MEDKWIWGAERYGNGWFVRNKNKPTDESWHFGMSSDAEQYGDVVSAIDRCKNLDELLYEIEEGKHTLVIE